MNLFNGILCLSVSKTNRRNVLKAKSARSEILMAYVAVTGTNRLHEMNIVGRQRLFTASLLRVLLLIDLHSVIDGRTIHGTNAGCGRARGNRRLGKLCRKLNDPRRRGMTGGGSSSARCERATQRRPINEMKYSQPPTAAVSRHLPPPPVILLRGYRPGSGVRSGGRSPGTSVLHSQTVATEDDRSLVKAVFTSSRFITRICTRLTCIRRKSSTFYRSSSGIPIMYNSRPTNVAAK